MSTKGKGPKPPLSKPQLVVTRDARTGQFVKPGQIKSLGVLPKNPLPDHDAMPPPRSKK